MEVGAGENAGDGRGSSLTGDWEAVPVQRDSKGSVDLSKALFDNEVMAHNSRKIRFDLAFYI